MKPDPTRVPALLGIGQSIEREAIVDVVELATRAAEKAFAEAPGMRERVQRLSLVGISFSPVSRLAASEIATRLGIDSVAREVTTPGGNTPQWLMGRACDAIRKGELETTLIVGAEATRSIRQSDPSYDFIMGSGSNKSGDRESGDPVVGAPISGMLSKAEIEAKLMLPAHVYPVFENALAARQGRTPEQCREWIAGFMSRGSAAAAKNPFAWFGRSREAEEFSRVTPSNRLTAEPYTKCMNSFANVDQGSALLVTTLARATEAGLADQCVFPWSSANNHDPVPVARADLAASLGIRSAARAAFQAAGVDVDDIDHFDLYSCFPVAVEVGAAEIGLSLDDPRGWTRTGGMATFGGPGNNYTSHGIAAIALALRESGRLGYVSGNGGLLTKHSIGVYGAEPPAQGFVFADTTAAQAEIDAAALPVAHAAEGTAVVDGGTVIYGRESEPIAAPIIGRLDDGTRFVAVAEASTLPALAGRNLTGRSVRVRGASPPVYSLAD